MNALTDSLINTAVQCWGCDVFDNLFRILSDAAASAYESFALIAILIFCAGLAFYFVYSVWKNIKSNASDPFYQKSIKPVLINSVIVFSLLGLGLQLPRFISKITFEPVADMTLFYSHTMLNTDTTAIEQKVLYQPQDMNDNGFFRPELRNKIIILIKTSISQFQSYIKLGFAVIDAAFSWSALTGIGALIKHTIMFFIGLYLVYGFFRIFLKFCFYFIDVIIYMTYFAFFFPISLILFPFKNSDAPDILKNLGNNFGMGQIKNIINAIITLGATVINYTVIMAIIAQFFAASGTNPTDLVKMITSGQDLFGVVSDDNLITLTLSGCIVLMYVINFIADQIPNITNKIIQAFEVSEDKNSVGAELADNSFKFTGKAFDTIKKVKNIITGKPTTDKK